MIYHSLRFFFCRHVSIFSLVLGRLSSAFNMYSIEFSISPSSRTTFGIQSAGEAYESSGALFTQGCKINESQGCSTACQDLFQISWDPYTLQNCMVLSALAPNPVPQSLGGANLSERSLEIAGRFAINTTNPGFQNLASNVIRTT